MKKLLLLLCAFMASISGAWAQVAAPTTAPDDPDPAPVARKVAVVYSNYFGVGLRDYNAAWGGGPVDGAQWTAIEEPVITGTRKVLHVTGTAFTQRLKTSNGNNNVNPVSAGYTKVHVYVYPMSATTVYIYKDGGWSDADKQSKAVSPGQWNLVEFDVPATWTKDYFGVALKNGEDLETEFYMDDFYFTNDDSYVDNVQTFGSFELPNYIFSATTGYNINATYKDTEGADFAGDVTLAWDGSSPIGSVINGNNIQFGAASGTGIFTLQATSDEVTKSKKLAFVNAGPEDPTDGASNVLAIFCGTYGTENYDGWNTGWEWGYGSRDILTLAGNNTVRIHNVGTYGFPYPNEADLTQYTKLHFDIYTVESVSGYVKIERTNINNKTFTTTAGAWKHVEIDLTGITMAAEGNRWIDFYIGENSTDKNRDILIDNIYFSKTAETITSISLDAASTEVPVSRTLQLTVKDQSDNVVAASLVDFEVNNANVSVDETGLVTGVAEGSATITATLKADNTIYNTYDLTVTPKPLGQEFVNGTHSIFVQAFHDVGTNNYELIITSEEQMEGMGGSFWNVNGEGADMRNTLVISGDKKTMTIVVESTSAPNIYTPLYILMPGEISFTPVTLEWIERVKDGLYVDVESTTATVIGTIAAGDITNLKTAAGDASIVDVSRATISSTVALEATNPNAVVIATDAQKTSLTGTKNLVIKDGSTYTADVITYTDQPGTVPADLAITTGEVSYTRTGMAVGKLFSVVLPFSAVIPANFKAYQVKAYDGSKMTFAEISGTTLSAGTAYVIKSETTNDFVASMTSTTLDFEEETSTTAGVTTTANLTQILDNTGDKYVLSDNKIKKLVGTAKVAAFRGYFTFTSAGSNVIDFNLEGDVTGIENLKSDNLDNAVFYDLNGHRVANPTKGLYIVNGKKVILK